MQNPINNPTHAKTLYFVQLAVFTAIIMVLNFTPLGFLKLGLVEITFMAIPVIVGAAVLGPLAGGILGFIFGVCSLSLAPTHPLFGVAFAQQPIIVATVCIIPRILIGVFVGYIVKFFEAKTKFKKLLYIIASLIGSLTNTILFLGGIILLLQNLLTSKMAEFGLLTGKTFLAFWVGIGIVNGVPEAIACTVISTAIIIPLKLLLKKQRN